MAAMSFPPSGQYLEFIRSSSKSLREKAGISISPESVRRFLLSPSFISSFQTVSKHHGLALPLNFSSPLDELNLLSILSLLNFGSGYRTQLHAATGRGAWDNIRALGFSMFLTSTVGEDDYLSAKGMQAITLNKVAELMRVSIHTERPHETIPGITVGEVGGPRHELVSLVTEVLNDTGRFLISGGYPSLGAFVAECLKEAEKSTDNKVEVVLEKLVRAIPAFQDMAIVHEQPIYCFKKALFLINAIHVRFGNLQSSPFFAPPTEQIPIFADNVIPSMLAHLGVLDLSASPSLSSLFPDVSIVDSLLEETTLPRSKDESQQVPEEGPVVTDNQAYELRAAAVDACEIIVNAARTTIGREQEAPGWMRDIRLADLDMWLWAVAKERTDYRNLSRFACKKTVFF